VTYRVVHCGRGAVGTAALQGILAHPDLELVGHHVWSPEKLGVDSGKLVGTADTGVIASDDWDELHDLGADCLSYFGDSLGRELECAADGCRFLERGTNAVTISTFPWAYPAAMPPEYGVPVRPRSCTADVLGVEIDDWNVVYESDSLDDDVETGVALVAAGTASVLHFELQALAGGRPIAVVEHADRVARGAGPQWPQPYGPRDLSYRIEVEGDPSYRVELNLSGPGSNGLKITAMPAINAIPAVCEADPGVKGPLDIPRSWARNARR